LVTVMRIMNPGAPPGAMVRIFGPVLASPLGSDLEFQLRRLENRDLTPALATRPDFENRDLTLPGRNRSCRRPCYGPQRSPKDIDAKRDQPP
jgi:hypothetical protein